jgi:hypothetical protein
VKNFLHLPGLEPSPALFCTASYLLSIPTSQSGLGFVCMRLQPAAKSNFVGRKQIRDILLSIFFIFEGESERVEERRVERRGMDSSTKPEHK